MECFDNTGTSNQLLISTTMQQQAPGQPWSNRRSGSSRDPLMEVMAFQDTSVDGDASKGIFNYYTASPGLIFEGNSIDAIEGRSACGQCHTGGGIVMKELDGPWLNWEHSHDMQGMRDAIAATPLLGFGTKVASDDPRIPEGARAFDMIADGKELEQMLKATGRHTGGNPAWNEARIDHLIAREDARELLRPLFCDTEFNLDNAAGSLKNRSNDDEPMKVSTLSSVPSDFFLDPQIRAGMTSISVDNDHYTELMEELGQSVPMTGVRRDSPFRMPFLERSFSDDDYVKSLIARDIIDAETVKDIRLVDFTRQVQSAERCSMLSALNGVAVSELRGETPVDENDPLSEMAFDPAQLRAILDESLSTSGAQGTLRDNLAVEGGHRDVVVEFNDACKARVSLSDEEKEGRTDEEQDELLASKKKSFLEDAMKIAERGRDIARATSQFEHPRWLPELAGLDSATASKRLDPQTCGLTDSLVLVSTEAEPEEEAPGGDRGNIE